MLFTFSAYPDFRQEIAERLKKMCKRFDKIPNTVINVKTSEKPNSDLLEYEVEILLPTLKYEGYTHVATLKKEVVEDEGSTEMINLVYPANGYDSEDFSKYFEVPFRCDHCRTNRNRYTVHLFRDDSSRELMIASTCAEDYFGANVARELGLISRYSMQELESDFEDAFDCFGRGCSQFDKTNYCRIAYGHMAHYNRYTSKKKAEEMMFYGITGKPSTADEINYIISDNRGCTAEEIAYKKAEVEKAIASAKSFDLQTIKDWWNNRRDENPTDNFTRSCALNFSMLEPKRGLLVYGVFQYMKDAEGYFTEKAENLPSNHVGNVGDRLKNLSLVVSFVSTTETAYGTMHIVKFIADSGDRFTWFSSSGFNGLQGDHVTLTGTVKKHDEYKGIKQTILTRCKFTINEEVTA